MTKEKRQTEKNCTFCLFEVILSLKCFRKVAEAKTKHLNTNFAELFENFSYILLRSI